MGSLRDTDHLATLAWLGRLEKKAASMDFPAFGGTAGTNAPTWGGNGSSTWSYFLPGATRDYASEAGDLWRNSAVAACLGWIADNFGEPRLEVVARQPDGREEPVVDHEFESRMCEPNPDYDVDALWAATVLSFAVSGNGYWIKAKALTGKAGQLYWVPYWEIEPRWNPSGKQFIDHYDHIVDGKRIPLRREDIVHFRRGLNPTNVRLGLPQLEPVLREIVSDNAANSYVAAILRNMGVPGVLITPETDNVAIDDDEADNIKTLWTEKASGDNAGSPMVLSLRMKIQQLTMSPEQLTLEKIREIPEARICAAFRLPAMVVGLSVGEKQKTYANMAVAERMAYRNCLVPLQKSFAKALTRQLLPDLGGKPGERVRWNYTAVEAMAEEQGQRCDRVVKLVKGGLMSKEEGRSEVGLGKVDPSHTFASLAVAKGAGKEDDPDRDTGPDEKSWRYREPEREDDDDPFEVI